MRFLVSTSWLILSFALSSAGLAIAEEKVGPEADPDWPRKYSYKDGSTLVLYQPQVESWDDFETIEARAAVAFSKSADAAPALGALELSATTEVDLDTRLVKIYDFFIPEGSFPTLSAGERNQALLKVAEILPQDGVVISLDRVLANLERGKERDVQEVKVNVEPPLIFSSSKPAVLVLIDGKPLLAPVGETGLKYVVNTNWNLMLDEASETYYLLKDDAWIKTQTLGGKWEPAGKLPKAFKKLPQDDENWKDVRQHVPGKKLKAKDVPLVYVSETPAELIVLEGEPLLKLIVGTNLLWATNSDSDLFFASGESAFYYLVSGRWFRAKLLEGPWSFATQDLPEDFAKIPSDHPRGHVRASVPGTPEAEEAVMLAQIPQKAKVERGKVTADVTYQGDPEFEEIEGTSLYYATNTQSDVIRVGDMYYLCFQAVWFASASPSGPWEIADSIPTEIYTIPASSPVHNVTYVRVYETSPVHVTFGYTSGYWGVYVSYGCVMFGTGWYYPPYVYWPPYGYPIYHPYPYSYGFRAYYNPYTGTYGRGAVAYGPYGGIGRSARYNPRTGTYARGASAWGPYEARGFVEAYNPRTGTYAQTRQGANVYSRWGTSYVSRGEDWVRTGRYSDSRGTVVGARTSEGRGAIGFRGDDRSGFVSRGEGGDLYAGRDGNVYRRGEEGWQRYDDGGWVDTDRRSPGERPGRDELQDSVGDRERGGQLAEGRPGDRPKTGDRAGTDRPRAGTGKTVDRGTLDQLDRDARGRASGRKRTESHRGWERSGRTRSGSYGRGRTGGTRGGGGVRGRRR